jgi:hypothetical protein
MRNAILVVTATDGDGEELPLLGGPRLPSYAGDLEGRPGRFFAKILEEIPTNYPDRLGPPIRIPAPQWVQGRIASDTRIAALETDESSYEFVLPEDGKVHVEARFIYRRAFWSFAQLKGWDIPDILIASNRKLIDAASSTLAREPSPKL